MHVQRKGGEERREGVVHLRAVHLKLLPGILVWHSKQPPHTHMHKLHTQTAVITLYIAYRFSDESCL